MLWIKKDWKKCVYSDSSIPAAATFFPMSAIVKPSLEDRDDRKAGMPDYQNVETIVAIPRVWVICNASSLFIANAVNKDRKIDVYAEAFGPIISEIV